MKQIKTAEEVLNQTIEDDYRYQIPDPESPVIRAMRTYAEQFIEAAAEECGKRIIPGHNVQAPSMINAGKAILKLKEHLK